MLDWPVERRIAYVRRDKWIEYAAAATATKALSALLEQPEKVRQRAVFVAARPDNGKSALLRRFVAIHSPAIPDGETMTMPVVRVWTPDEPTEAKLWAQVLKAVKAPFRANERARDLKEQALRELEFLQVRMLMFDEVHNLLQGTERKTTHLLTLLKMLVNELPLRIAVAGTKDATRALAADQQLATRFDSFGLPPWREGTQLLGLLKGLEAIMPLPEPSNLATPDIVRLLLPKANQAIGGYVVQIQRAAELAMAADKPCIDADLIRAAQRNAGTDVGKAGEDL